MQNAAIELISKILNIYALNDIAENENENMMMSFDQNNNNNNNSNNGINKNDSNARLKQN